MSPQDQFQVVRPWDTYYKGGVVSSSERHVRRHTVTTFPFVRDVIFGHLL